MNNSFNSTFSSISPSAKSLLLTKALTSIPFVKEVIEIMRHHNTLQISQEKEFTTSLILRLIHFETRYWSIDKALSEVDIKNILEIASGFSFRGLDLCRNPKIHYIDTDLPNLIEKKIILMEELIKKYCHYSPSNLTLLELNALDEQAFMEIVKKFPEGSIAIVDEGLLIYLNEEQKRKLCSIIYKILKIRDGYWITADIYVKKNEESKSSPSLFDIKGQKFLEKHNVEQNKFENFTSAQLFFNNRGFKIHKKIEPTPTQISSRKFLGRIPRSQLEKLINRKKMRETWIITLLKG